MSFLFGKKQETEREEYERLLKEATQRHQRVRESMMKDLDARMAPHREMRARFKYLEEKFNPNEDKISIIIPDQRETHQKRIKETRENKFEEIVKKYPNISFEEAILRSFHQTGVYYTDEYFIKKFKQLSNTNLTNSSPPKPPPLPSVPKRQSPKSPPKRSSPPNPPPLPSAPKRSSPKKSKSPPKPPPLPSASKRSSPKKSKSPPKPPPLPSASKRSSPKKSELSKETLQSAKSKLKRYIHPESDNYDLEMAFKNLDRLHSEK
jgi:hypothetical protein